MCGLASEVRVGELADIELVARKGATMTNRGPDGNGVWASGPLALSFRRLKIIDLSEQASQPTVDSELGLTITFNGCINNYPELPEMLEKKGYCSISTSDTEALLKAYHHCRRPAGTGGGSRAPRYAR